MLINMTLFAFILINENKGAPVGGEFQVNTYTTDSQLTPSMAMDPAGNFIIVWSSEGQDGDGYGIYAQRFDKNGNPLGSEFRVNTYTTGDQGVSTVEMDAAGNFVIAWHSDGQDLSLKGIFAKRYDFNGNPLGPEFQVNTFTFKDQHQPSIAMNATGHFVIAWTSEDQDGDQRGVYAQRFDNLGNPQGGEFQVNTYTTERQGAPQVAMNSTGEFVIVWTSYDQDGDFWGVFAQLFDKNGNPNGAEFQVNIYNESAQASPAVEMDPVGNFVITWHSYGQDGDESGVFARHYDNNGNPQTTEFQVNTYTTRTQGGPEIDIDASGNYLIVWQSYEQDGDGWGIYARYLDGNGNPLSPEFQVNTYTTSFQISCRVAMNATGHSVIAWQSRHQDGDWYGIFAQLYDNNLFWIYDIQAEDVTVSTASISWNSTMPANSTVEYGFTASYGSTVQNDTKVTSHTINLTGLEPGRSYHFRVSSYNDSLSSISRDFTFSTKYSMELKPGWNMISFPLNQTDTNLGKVLESINGRYDAVQYYDVTDPSDFWKHNHTSKTPQSNVLTDINRFMGIWIHITNPSGQSLSFDGIAPEIGYVNQVPLYNGWNLVGYPSLIERAPGSSDLPAEVDMVQWFNQGTGKWESWDPGGLPDTLNVLKSGQGLWIHYTGVSDVWSLEYVN
ncbi:MAG: fibronectin type III domain-containing protein [Thermoplasmata archaeon]|nr:MAG: fibronectin type III domain-containing protein [Thermoplasmata archaeon]